VVLHLARQKLACGDLSLNSVAEQLDMGPRTLQRRLRIEGVSFRVVSNASCYGVSPTSYRPSGKRSGYPSASAEPC
jgi:AraC-like DNA-binding protein